MRFLLLHKSLALSALALMGVLSISACDATLPEDEVRLCVKGGVTQDIVDRLADITRRHHLSFDDSGAQNRSELIGISADNAIIPTGVATNLLVRDGRTVVLMGTNLGSTGDLLVLSFFNVKDDARRLSFKRDLLAETTRIPGARVIYRGPDPDGDVSCGTASTDPARGHG
ncbi:MAG TPA: hypothetical protein VK403_00400 [Allosphingosinicella sp.]|nr:hypothetical protein [Allosphingosinicella sp.]